MTDRTLHEKIAAHCRATIGACESGFPVSALNEARAMLEILDAHTAAQPAPDAVAEAAWSGVENAPYDTPLTVLAGGMTFAAILRRDASLNEDGESCDQWQAVVEGEHPPCWTDGACWESNEDGIPCLWPEAFMPLTKPADFRTAAKGHQP